MLRFLLVLLSTVPVLGLVDARPAAANPYVWVSVQATLRYAADGAPVALRQAWRFDRHFSTFAAKGVDRNGDRRIDAGELAAAAALNVKALAKFGYFTKVSAGGRPVALGPPTAESMSEDGGTLTLAFTLPLLHAPATEVEPLTVSVYDPAFFLAFALAPGEAVRLDGAPAACAVRISRPPQPPVPAGAKAAAVLASRPVDLAGTTGARLADKAIVECGSDLLAFAPPAPARFPPFDNAAPPAAAPPQPAIAPPPADAAQRVEQALRLAAAKPLTDAGLLAPLPLAPTASPASAPAAPARAAAPRPAAPAKKATSGRSVATAAPASAPGFAIGPAGIVAALLLLGLGAAGAFLARGLARR
ncbi:MAG TPA: DUF1007 family protein [Hyphomicrobiales bacterium]|nr:DUF1007 family protein [Hyphomicrobiales bacterium]